MPAIERLPVRSAIIDGEVIVEDKRGVSDFVLLQSELKSPRSRHLAYVAFDLLYLDGESQLPYPLSQRKQRLAAFLPMRGGPLRYCQHLAGDGPTILQQAAQLGLEGIVSKRLDKPYRPEREDWRKSKITMTDEFVVCGYVNAASPKEAVGALALGFYENGRLIYAGRVGSGFTRDEACALWRELQGARGVASCCCYCRQPGGPMGDTGARRAGRVRGLDGRWLAAPCPLQRYAE